MNISLNRFKTMFIKKLRLPPHDLRVLVVIHLMAILLLSSCSTPPPSSEIPEVKELVIYNWEDYIPQTAIDAFQKEHNVRIKVITYESQDEQLEKIQKQQIAYDIAVVESESLPILIADDLLAEINYKSVPNFKYISPNFRDLAFDPGNTYSIPYNYGTTGFLVRTDLVQQPINHWIDLWEIDFPGKIAIRELPLEITSITLKSFGLPIFTKDPENWKTVSEKLAQIKPKIMIVPVTPEGGVEPLLTGEAVILLGWSGDAYLIQDQHPEISYILPEEGTFLWGDFFVISALSPNKDLAELFINFMLQPEVSAQVVNTYAYASANEGAISLVNPEFANNTIVYPPKDVIQKADWFAPFDKEAEILRQEVWDQFMENIPK